MKATLSPQLPKAPTKAQDAHERLLEMATALGPNARLPTIQQLRRELNVSLTTLDSVLKQLESQSIICRRHGLGIFVSPRLRQKCIGLVCDPAFFCAGTSPFWQQFIEGVRSRTSQHGEAFRFYLAMRSSDDALPIHDDLIEDVKAQRIQGVLFVGNNLAAQEWLEQQNVASVVFAGQGIHRVELDIIQLVNLAGRHLVAKGCQRIALLCPWEVRAIPPQDLVDETADTEEEWDDIAAFRQLLAESGLSFFPELIWDVRNLGERVTSVPETHQEQGYQAVMNLFDGSHPAPDGLLSTDDMMTRGILAALRKLGLKPGHDVQIASHINRGSTVLTTDDESVAFVEIDPSEIVSTMFSQLEKLMECQINHQTPPQSCVLVSARYRN